jgi:hypothetical protein
LVCAVARVAKEEKDSSNSITFGNGNRLDMNSLLGET